jgi:glycine hydroxymethyltransferase
MDPGPPDRLRIALMRSSLAQADAVSRTAINLVPSEARLSPLAAGALRSDFYHRYFFNDQLDPTFWQFRGGQPACQFETDVALPSLRRLGTARHVNLRPISGMSAMLVVMAGLGGPPGHTVVSLSQETGGHYATASVARRLGFASVTVAIHRGVVDQAVLHDALSRHQPSLVYLDLQNSRHVLDIAAVAAAIAETSPRTLLHADCSHTLGLVLGRALPNPLDLGADTFGGSTHKTFPGPHKGVLMTRRDDLAERLREAQFTLLSSHHFAETIALGLAAVEFEHFGTDYARRVIANAQQFEAALAAAGFDVATDGTATQTHQVWVRIGDAEQTDVLARTLYQAGIRVNIQVDLPGLPGPVLRLGVNEFTFTGAGPAAVHHLATAFHRARDRDMPGLTRAAADVRAALDQPCYFTDFDTGYSPVPARSSRGA